jgi:hypothetical protein
MMEKKYNNDDGKNNENKINKERIKIWVKGNMIGSFRV